MKLFLKSEIGFNWETRLQIKILRVNFEFIPLNPKKQKKKQRKEKTKQNKPYHNISVLALAYIFMPDQPYGPT